MLIIGLVHVDLVDRCEHGVDVCDEVSVLAGITRASDRAMGHTKLEGEAREEWSGIIVMMHLDDRATRRREDQVGQTSAMRAHHDLSLAEHLDLLEERAAGERQALESESA